MGRYGTTTKFLLEALLPDTRRKEKQKRSELIAKLARQRDISPNSLQVAFKRAIKAGLITINEFACPELTPKGRHTVLPFIAPTLPGSVLMIVFDIAEADRRKRDHLRLLLKELSFRQVQKSVWITKFDHREYLQAEIKALGLEKEVQAYEANPL